MNIFINISHPAHVHFFKKAVRILSERGHNIIIGARHKEFTTMLLEAAHLNFTLLTKKGQGLTGLIKELLLQQWSIAKIIRRQKIDMMLQIGGIFNAPVGKLYRIPTLAFSDTENETWGNRLSFTLSRHVLLPTCFEHDIGGQWKRQIHYPGYHELAYLSPRDCSRQTEPEEKFLLRFVGWGAGHDIGETGLSNRQKVELAQTLSKYGKVHISSEAPLPEPIAGMAYKLHPLQIHDFMKNCKMVVGESATMASESACLGIPAVFISNTGRGYTTEQDNKYGLIKHYRLNQWEEILATIKKWANEDLKSEWLKRRCKMLQDKIDVTAWLVDLIEEYPQSIVAARNGSFEKYRIKCAE